MPSSLFHNNLQLQCQLVVTLCILDIYFTVRDYRLALASTLLQTILRRHLNGTRRMTYMS